MNNLDTSFPETQTYAAIAKLGGEGILTVDDLPQLGSQRRRVFALMMDGKWHRANLIVEVAGGTEGLRRMRELRELPGVEIQRKEVDGIYPAGTGRVFWYRMVITKPACEQIELAV